MEAVGAFVMQQIYAGMEEYCNLLAAQLPPAEAAAPPHRFPDGFFEDICRAVGAQCNN